MWLVTPPHLWSSWPLDPVHGWCVRFVGIIKDKARSILPAPGYMGVIAFSTWLTPLPQHSALSYLYYSLCYDFGMA